MSDRPKASYLDWFKELIANYKLIAMLIVTLGGYSGFNLWKDVDKALNKPDEEVVETPNGIQSVSKNLGYFALENP